MMSATCTQGKALNIGVSNFSVVKLKHIMETCKIKPAVVQVDCALHCVVCRHHRHLTSA